jgi:hypothetical protein
VQKNIPCAGQANVLGTTFTSNYATMRNQILNDIRQSIATAMPEFTFDGVYVNAAWSGLSLTERIDTDILPSTTPTTSVPQGSMPNLATAVAFSIVYRTGLTGQNGEFLFKIIVSFPALTGSGNITLQAGFYYGTPQIALGAIVLGASTICGITGNPTNVIVDYHVILFRTSNMYAFAFRRINNIVQLSSTWFATARLLIKYKDVMTDNVWWGVITSSMSLNLLTSANVLQTFGWATQFQGGFRQIGNEVTEIYRGNPTVWTSGTNPAITNPVVAETYDDNEFMIVSSPTPTPSVGQGYTLPTGNNGGIERWIIINILVNKLALAKITHEWV